MERRRSTLDEREMHLEVSERGRALRRRVPALKRQLLCEHGIETEQLEPLRAQLDALLQRMAEQLPG